jgi:hypothetical protein
MVCLVCRIGRIMDTEIALGIVAAAIGAGVLSRLAREAVTRFRLHWSLRKMHFCPGCGVVMAQDGLCLRCGQAGSRREPAPAGEDSPSPN